MSFNASVYKKEEQISEGDKYATKETIQHKDKQL